MSKVSFASSDQHTIGVELELGLVDEDSMELSSSVAEVLARIPDSVDQRCIKPELMQCVVEINTAICHTVADAETDLREKLTHVEAITDQLGLRLWWGATHPFSRWQDQQVTPDERYAQLVNLLQEMARRLVTFGLHVHVGVDSGDKAVMICDRIMQHLPTMLALSCSSPFWEKRNTGLQSHRSKIMEGLPTAGLPTLMRNWSEYVWLVNHMIDTGFINTIRELWWDVRPHHNFGTVEVRVCDMPGNLEDTMTLTALIQCLVKALSDNIDQGTYQHDCHPMMVRQNKWRACRFGLRADLVDSYTYEAQPLARLVEQLIHRLQPAADELGCRDYLQQCLEIIARPSWADRQREILAQTGDPAEVVRRLSEQSRSAPAATLLPRPAKQLRRPKARTLGKRPCAEASWPLLPRESTYLGPKKSHRDVLCPPCRNVMRTKDFRPPADRPRRLSGRDRQDLSNLTVFPIIGIMTVRYNTCGIVSLTRNSYATVKVKRWIMRIQEGALGFLTRCGCCAALLFMLATLSVHQARSQDGAAEDQAASTARNAARRAALSGRRVARSAQSKHQSVRAAYLQEEGNSVLTESVPAPPAGAQANPVYQEGWAPGVLPAVEGYDAGGCADGCGGNCGGSCDLGGGSCGSCGSCGPCPCGPPGRFWVRGDYLLWWTKGLSTPELVTTSPFGVPREQAGVLGWNHTRVPFGHEDLLKTSRSGGRVKAGIWLDCCNKYGIEGDYFALGDESDDFRAVSFGGDPILARPFFNALTGREDSELVGFPFILEGAVGVEVESSFSSAGVRWRHNLCCSELACMPECNAPTCNLCYVSKGTSRWDLLLGYRFMRLDESILMTEDLNSLTSPTQFYIFDEFETETEFHGVEVGLAYEFHRCRWSLDLLAKVALGSNHQSVRIDGGTEIVTAGFPNNFSGGLLAQRTNSGEFERDKFGAIPEIGITLGYRLTDQLKLTMGYTFIYWSKVVRPGEQIDRAVNPNLLPPEAVPFSGPLRPAFAFNDTDYWAQGLNFGGELRW